MMQLRLFVAILVSLTTLAGIRHFSFQPVQKVASVTPSWSDDQAVAVATDQAGNVCVTGYSHGSGKGHDFLTLKYDP